VKKTSSADRSVDRTDGEGRGGVDASWASGERDPGSVERACESGTTCGNVGVTVEGDGRG